MSRSKKNKTAADIRHCFIIAAIVLIIAGAVWFSVKILVPLFRPYSDPPAAEKETTLPIAYRDEVEKYALEYNVPESVIYAVIYAESNFNANADSSAGAHGLMQITDETFEWLSILIKDGSETADIYDPDVNIRYGTYFLSYLYNRFGDWRTVFAAYNAGEGCVAGWIEENSGELGDIPYPETDAYVGKVMNARIKYEKMLNDNNTK